MNNENKEFSNNDIETNISEEEIILAPPTELFDKAKEIEQNTRDDEKFPFVLQYDSDQKEFLLSILETVGAVVEDADENGQSLLSQMNMTQLSFIKCIDCVERVITDEVRNPFIRDEAISHGSVENEAIDETLINTVEPQIVEKMQPTHIVTRAVEDSPVTLVESITSNVEDGIAVMCVDGSSSSCCCPSNTDMENAKEIQVEDFIKGCICCPYSEQWFKFTVAQTKQYTIYTSGSLDTIGTLCDCYGNCIAQVDDVAGKLNFRIVQTLNAGATYYIWVRAYGGSTGSYTLRVTEQVFANYVIINRSTITLEKGVLYELPITPNYTYKGYKGAQRIPGLSVSIYPINANEQKIWWWEQYGDVLKCSYGWDDDGNRYIHVMATGIGTEKLYARDWNESGSRHECTVCVDRYSVTGIIIEKTDANHSRIIFPNGKIWNCMNFDIINNYSLNQDDLESQRFYDNVYKTKVYDESTAHTYYDEPFKEYTDEELKVIYMIDPHGMAAYVREYAAKLPDSEDGVQTMLSTILAYKDRIFRMLFGRSPRHYKRNTLGNWYQTTDTSDWTDVVSESECLFGGHSIYDGKFWLEFFTIILDIVTMVLPSLGLSERIVEKTLKAIKYYSLLRSVSQSALDEDFNGFLSAIANGLSDDKELEETILIKNETYKVQNYTLDWAFHLLSFSSDLDVLADTFSAGPHFYKAVFTQCSNDTDYDVYLRTADGNLVSVSDLADILD